jgi:signal transduction histidine kinase
MKTKTLPDITFEHPGHRMGRAVADPATLDAFEVIAGRETAQPAWNVTGAMLACEAVVLRTSPTNAFAVCVKIGGQVFGVAQIAAGNPAIAQLHEAGAMIESGPSPHQVEAQRRKDERQAEERARQEAYARKRSELAAERLRKAEERQEANRAANRAAYGW